VAAAGDLVAGRSHHVFRLESELALEVLQWSGRPERAHADDFAAATDVPLPAEGGGCLHRYAHGDLGRDDAVAVLLTLALEQLP
jgi:hypothetical protein